MAKFFFKKLKRIFVLKPDRQQIVEGQIFTTPGEFLEVKNGYLETDDPKIIDRIRKDPQFGTEEIVERTEEDDEAIKIRELKSKEAEAEIKARKRAKKLKAD